MLKNEYLLAKIGVDTADNELSKVWRNGVPADSAENQADCPQQRTGPQLQKKSISLESMQNSMKSVEKYQFL